VEEQFNSPCTTEIAAFDRFVKFMDDPEYDLVIFDTAPTGHTIRLLELPVNWSEFIDLSAKGSGQTCLGPVQAIQESKAMYDKAITELRNPGATTFIFVVQPEAVAIGETERSVAEIRQLGVKSIELIVNAILPEEVCQDPFFRARWEMQQRHLQEIERRLIMPARRMFLEDDEIKGVKKLRRTGQILLEGETSTKRGDHEHVSA
jgi:arsenite-transporting ATPase